MFRFCGSKCHKNFTRKRNPRKFKWTKAFRRAAGKEMAVDTTFDFEKRRNRPVKYDCETTGKTLLAIKKVKEVQTKREQRFFENRHRGAKSKQKAKIKADTKENIELLAPSATQDREKTLATITDKAKQMMWKTLTLLLGFQGSRGSRRIKKVITNQLFIVPLVYPNFPTLSRPRSGEFRRPLRWRCGNPAGKYGRVLCIFHPTLLGIFEVAVPSGVLVSRSVMATDFLLF